MDFGRVICWSWMVGGLCRDSVAQHLCSEALPVFADAEHEIKCPATSHPFADPTWITPYSR